MTLHTLLCCVTHSVLGLAMTTDITQSIICISPHLWNISLNETLQSLMTPQSLSHQYNMSLTPGNTTKECRGQRLTNIVGLQHFLHCVKGLSVNLTSNLPLVLTSVVVQMVPTKTKTREYWDQTTKIMTRIFVKFQFDSILNRNIYIQQEVFKSVFSSTFWCYFEPLKKNPKTASQHTLWVSPIECKIAAAGFFYVINVLLQCYWLSLHWSG